MISMIYDVVRSEDEITVRAVIEDVVLMHNQTLYDPPEYGPAVCTGTFTLEEGEELPEDEDELVQFIENLDLNWEIEDNSDDYID